MTHIEKLNAIQNCGRFHPYTCGGNRTDEAHRKYQAEHGGDFGQLVATESGWICPVCDYTQPFTGGMPHDCIPDELVDELSQPPASKPRILPAAGHTVRRITLRSRAMVTDLLEVCKHCGSPTKIRGDIPCALCLSLSVRKIRRRLVTYRGMSEQMRDTADPEFVPYREGQAGAFWDAISMLDSVLREHGIELADED